MKPKPVEVTLSPVDNQRLATLCGAFDENLRQIEIALDITIARRGERFVLKGQSRQTARGAEVLERFYNQAKRGLTIDDVQLGLVEVRQTSADAETPALLTRKPDLHGRTPRQIEYMKNILEHDITFGIGPAGTGKTYLAVACAVDYHMSHGKIEGAPLAYMRGRTFKNAYVIMDEAQNTTPAQMQMFLTRIGFGSKAVVTGDVTQIDLPRGSKSGLIEARRILAEVRGLAFTLFLAEDVVRHPLVQRIVNAYERQQNEG